MTKEQLKEQLAKEVHTMNDAEIRIWMLRYEEAVRIEQINYMHENYILTKKAPCGAN